MQSKQKPLPFWGRGLNKVNFYRKDLCDWVKAEVSSLADLTMFTYPDFVELVHCLLHDFWVIGQDACLEVYTCLYYSQYLFRKYSIIIRNCGSFINGATVSGLKKSEGSIQQKISGLFNIGIKFCSTD